MGSQLVTKHRSDIKDAASFLEAVKSRFPDGEMYQLNLEEGQGYGAVVVYRDDGDPAYEYQVLYYRGEWSELYSRVRPSWRPEDSEFLTAVA